MLPLAKVDCGRVCAQTTLADPHIRPPRSHPQHVTFQSPQFSEPFRPIGFSALLMWLTLLGVAFLEIVRRPLVRSWLLTGLMFGLAFHFTFHLVWGDDLFLYSAHWTFPVIAGTALALRHHWDSRWLNAVQAALLISVVANNGIFFYDLIRILN